MKKFFKWLFGKTQKCDISDVCLLKYEPCDISDVCLLKYETNECERFGIVKSCKHCPWENKKIDETI